MPWKDIKETLEVEMEYYQVPNSDLYVMQNGSGELFVRRKSEDSNGCRIRISPYGYGSLEITSGNGYGKLEPGERNGLPAFRVLPE